MSPWIVSATVFLTILLALSLGVGLGYLLAVGLLRAIGHRPQRPVEAPPLRAAEIGSSGD